MLSFLSTFSQSFLVALLAWPFLAAVLTIPLLVVQYRRYNRLVGWRAVGAYFLMLYIVGLASFTLYPMPDNPAVFCQDYHLSPQLNPFGFIGDIQNDGTRAILQVVMNLVFFIPLGVFARLFFRWRIGTTVIVGFLTSLLIETAQLTGVFGLYPCSYRLFDVDDLAINTIGGVLGYVLALVLPQPEVDRAQKGTIVRHPGLLRYAVAFIIDGCVATVLQIMLLLGLYVVGQEALAYTIRDSLPFVVTMLVFGVLPYLCRGYSLGGFFVRLVHDDQARPPLRRALFYLVRTLYVAAIIYGNGLGTLFILVLTFISWKKWKKLPFQLV